MPAAVGTLNTVQPWALSSFYAVFQDSPTEPGPTDWVSGSEMRYHYGGTKEAPAGVMRYPMLPAVQPNGTNDERRALQAQLDPLHPTVDPKDPQQLAEAPRTSVLFYPGTGRNAELPHWAAWTDGAARFAILDTERGGGLRMAEGSETAADIASSILADSSYQSVRRRCQALAAIYDWAPLSFSVHDYAEIGRGLCHAHPIRDLLDSF